MPDWLRTAAPWLGAFSLVGFLLTPLIVAVLIARMPADYFARPPRARAATPRGPLRAVGHVAKNVLGAILVLAGVAMLVLPGQGILTILVGLALVEFPGKYALERRLVRRPRVHAALDWIRNKAGKPPLQI